MTASATTHASNGSAGRNRSGDRPSPLVRALDRLFPKRGTAPYATLERLVALVIVRAMSLDSDTGDWNCFLSYPTIARWSGTSVASVKRMLQKHSDGPAPLFFRPGPARRVAIGISAIASRGSGIRSSSPPRATQLGPNVPKMCSARCAISNPNASHCSDSSSTSAER